MLLPSDSQSVVPQSTRTFQGTYKVKAISIRILSYLPPLLLFSNDCTVAFPDSLYVMMSSLMANMVCVCVVSCFLEFSDVVVLENKCVHFQRLTRVIFFLVPLLCSY